jgi:hypothetical protein
MKPFIKYVFSHIVCCALLLLAIRSLAAEPRDLSAHKRDFKLFVAENRVWAGISNANGTYYSVLTDANLASARRGINTSKPGAPAVVISKGAPPVKELVSILKVERPLFLFQDPRKPAPVSIGSVSVKDIVTGRGKTNQFGLGLIQFERRPLLQSLDVIIDVQTPGLRIMPAPAPGAGDTLPSLLKKKP